MWTALHVLCVQLSALHRLAISKFLLCYCSVLHPLHGTLLKCS